MVLFNSWSRQKKKLCGKKINITEFVNILKSHKVFYSTPAGVDNSGNNRLYILNSVDSETKYYPAFLSKQNCISFFNSIGRKEFLIIEGNLKSLLDSLDTSPMLSQCGAVIEPNGVDEITIQPNIRVTL